MGLTASLDTIEESLRLAAACRASFVSVKKGSVRRNTRIQGKVRSSMNAAVVGSSRSSQFKHELISENPIDVRVIRSQKKDQLDRRNDRVV